MLGITGSKVCVYPEMTKMVDISFSFFPRLFFLKLRVGGHHSGITRSAGGLHLRYGLLAFFFFFFFFYNNFSLKESVDKLNNFSLIFVRFIGELLSK